MLGPTLRGSLISLEPLSEEELDLYRSWFTDLEISRYLLMRFVPSAEQEREWFRGMASSNSDVVWNIVLEGQVIGNTGLHGIDWMNRHASTGTVIGDKSQWGKGFGSESVRLRTAYAFDELGLERLETQSLADNGGMHRALERSGYQKIGRQRRFIYRGGRWHDTFLFELLRDDWYELQKG